MKKSVYFFLGIILLVISLIVCLIYSSAFNLTTTNSQPTQTLTPTAVPTDTFNLNRIRQVLSSNGFVSYPEDEQFCGQPCKSYQNSKYNLIAFSYDNTSLAIGIKFITNSGVKGSDQADLVFNILKSTYPKEVVKWTVDEIGKLDNEPKTGLISRYYIHMETISVTNGTGITIFITPFDIVPGKNNG